MNDSTAFVKKLSRCRSTCCLDSLTSQDTGNDPGVNKCYIYETDHELKDMANKPVRRTSGMPDSR